MSGCFPTSCRLSAAYRAGAMIRRTGCSVARKTHCGCGKKSLQRRPRPLNGHGAARRSLRKRGKGTE